MRRFSFRLQPVLKLREKREEEALQHLARAQKEYHLRLNELAKVNLMLEKSFEVAPAEQLSLEEEFHLAMWRQHLTNARESRQEEVAKAREKLAACRDRALLARREKLVLEKLKERQLRAHIQEELRAEQKELDEKGIQMVWYVKEGNFS